MHYRNNFLILAACCLLFSSCFTTVPIQSTPPKNNATYTVSYLFEHEGCKVYRFEDCGRTVYFTNCNGEAMAFDSTEHSKNIIRNKKDTP